MKRFTFDPQLNAWRPVPGRAQIAPDRFGHLVEMAAGYTLMIVAVVGLVALVTG